MCPVVSICELGHPRQNMTTMGSKSLRTPLFYLDDVQHMATGFVALIAHTKPTVLYVNGGRLSAKMIGVALSAQLSELPN